MLVPHLELFYKLIFAIYIRERSEFTSYLKAMKASPISPPIMCTPPSGIERPVKKFRISRAFAVHGRFCKRIMTLILTQEISFNLFVILCFSISFLQADFTSIATNPIGVLFYTHTFLSQRLISPHPCPRECRSCTVWSIWNENHRLMEKLTPTIDQIL